MDDEACQLKLSCDNADGFPSAADSDCKLLVGELKGISIKATACCRCWQSASSRTQKRALHSDKCRIMDQVW
jgi:hypothetical protein